MMKKGAEMIEQGSSVGVAVASISNRAIRQLS